MADSVVVDTTPSYAQDACYTAENDRRLFASLVCEEGVAFGACPTGDLLVEDSPTGGLTVQVNPGSGWVEGESISCQGMYHVVNSVTRDLAIAPIAAPDSRVDLVVLIVEDAQFEVTTEARAEVIEGVPNAGAPAVPANAIPLAEVAVAGDAVEIVPGDITDRRTPYQSCTGGQAEIVIFTSSGTFSKANHPTAREFHVRVVGGGGGGGGAQGGAGAAAGAGGSAGNYSESILTPDQLSASETVTIGTGGTGGAGASASAGNSGNPSSLGSLIAAEGGGGGAGATSVGVHAINAGGVGATPVGPADFTLRGGDGGNSLTVGSGSDPRMGGTGGGNALAGERRGRISNGAGGNGYTYGGGGSGGVAAGTSFPGGNGADGVIIIEVR